MAKAGVRIFILYLGSTVLNKPARARGKTMQLCHEKTCDLKKAARKVRASQGVRAKDAAQLGFWRVIKF